ncbi:hypothetical protein, partial [Streptomyces sp. URMC 123]|uniref:hypothetical protein n=1 Tax=Streptomyces sp. URMC 123 TaxID=3423403 RepID=UPI003F1A4A3B
MNIRSLTRGDGVVIGAAVLLFIASFLDYYSLDCGSRSCGKDDNIPNLWDSDLFPVLPSVVLAGVIAALLIVAARFLPAGRKVGGLALDQWGAALAVFSAWTALWTMFGGPFSGERSFGMGVTVEFEVGLGRILALVATVLLALIALLGSRVPALKAPLLGAPRPQAPSPYGAPQPGYGYPAQQGAQPGYGYPGQTAAPSPYGAAQPAGVDPAAGPATGQTGAAQPGAAAPAQPAAEFAPFWFAVPVTRPLYAEDGSPTPIAELAPGTWYLAVDQRGQALVAQTQDGR